MSTIYARMEEISFRSGAAVAAAAVAVAGTAIALPMVLAGHSAVAMSAPVPRATVRITGRSAAPSPVLPTASPSATVPITGRGGPAASLIPARASQPPTAVTTPRPVRFPVAARYHPYYAPFPWSRSWRWNSPARPWPWHGGPVSRRRLARHPAR